MFTKIKIAASILALTVLTAAPAQAFNMLQEEQAFESSTSDVRLPANDLRSFRIRHCADCTPVTLTLSAGSQYQANGIRVTYKLFRDLSEQQGKNLMVFYDPKTMRVTRMTLTGVDMESN